QNNDSVRYPPDAIEGIHFAAGGPQQGFVALLRFNEPVPGQNIEGGPSRPVQTVARAATPRPQNRGQRRRSRRDAVDQKSSLCGGDLRGSEPRAPGSVGDGKALGRPSGLAPVRLHRFPPVWVSG